MKEFGAKSNTFSQNDNNEKLDLVFVDISFDIHVCSKNFQV